jgi:hypothetical protein
MHGFLDRDSTATRMFLVGRHEVHSYSFTPSLSMNQRIKWICVSMVGVSVAVALVQVFLFRNVPSLSYQGSYVERHLWTESSGVFGVPPTESETVKVWDKHELSNPLDHSIWITGRKTGCSGLVEGMIEFRVARGSATAAAYPKPPGDRWMTGRECGLDGFGEIEVSSKSAVVVLLPARTRSEGADVAEFRMPYTSDCLASRVSRSGFAVVIHEISRRLGISSIPVQLRSPLERLPDEVDHVVDHRLPSPTPMKP